MNKYLFKQPSDYLLEIAKKEKNFRKRKKYTQTDLANRAGISLGSLKRFEQTGEISFNSLLKIAHVLDVLEDFENLFKEKDVPTFIQKLF
ncbi:MAG: helix-turn-helix transcriptional regulator [Flavobacteriia bacterium]|nr:helix-turn-helix transcriptional regulator [Flavobacteriia bacterium]